MPWIELIQLFQIQYRGAMSATGWHLPTQSSIWAASLKHPTRMSEGPQASFMCGFKASVGRLIHLHPFSIRYVSFHLVRFCPLLFSYVGLCNTVRIHCERQDAADFSLPRIGYQRIPDSPSLLMILYDKSSTPPACADLCILFSNLHPPRAITDEIMGAV